MSEKIKKQKKEEGEWNVPNKGIVWKSDWTDDIDAPEKKLLKFEFFSREKEYDSSKLDGSAEAENRIVDFRKRNISRAGRVLLMDRRESLRKAA